MGLTWVLIVGIIFGYFNLNLNVELLHFLREFGLVLFVYSLGLQVGPGFFASFKKGGLQLNMLVLITIFISIFTAIGVYYATGTPITAIVGILSGAVTNTPGMGAAQQAFFSIKGGESRHRYRLRTGLPDGCHRCHPCFHPASLHPSHQTI